MTFEIAFPDTLDEAIALGAEGSLWLAGGTDVVPEYKPGHTNPTRLVNLKRISELRGIEFAEDGVHIGATTTLAEIASDSVIRREFRALAQACELSASPQVRNVATIGGNLNQDSRCLYYRGDFRCYLKGGDTCLMRNGQNSSAAIVGYHDCVHVQPSDPATALVALDAELLVRDRVGEQLILAADFFRAPQGGDRRMTALVPGQMIREIRLPRPRDKSRSIFLKAMDRASWAFAVTSAAVRVDLNDETIADARVVLGGVAPIPWREPQVEQLLVRKHLAEVVGGEASAAVLRDASPLAHNRYKLRLGRALVKRALLELLEPSKGGP